MSNSTFRTWVLLVTAFGWVGCAASSDTQSVPRRAQLYARELSRPVPVFAVAAGGDDLPHPTTTGSWPRPLKLEGMVLDSGKGGEPLPSGVRTPDWQGRYRILLQRSPTKTVLVRYDAPVAPAPLRYGEEVQVYAHTMALGPRLAHMMAIRDRGGELRMAGIRTPELNAVPLPDGWSVSYGPVHRAAPLCDGKLEERSLRVRGPGGTLTVKPGWSAVGKLGPQGQLYAVDVAVARHGRASCPRAERETKLSFVIRRIDARSGEGRPGSQGHGGAAVARTDN